MKTEPKIGEHFMFKGKCFCCVEDFGWGCLKCAMRRLNIDCMNVECQGIFREDGKHVYFIREACVLYPRSRGRRKS